MGRKLIISGDRKSTELDTMDRAIITRLNQNARQNFAGIASELNTTSKTVINRVKNLENKNIIKGYSINISSGVLGTYRYHLFLSFDFLDEETENKFTKFCEYSPNIIEMIKVFGEWDDILVIETFSTAEFKKILFAIKEQFAESLHNYSFLESEDLKLWKYLPDLDL
jgi:DNA-binding Lrp family transcriptional regulator